MKKSVLLRKAKITHYTLSKLPQVKDVLTEANGKIYEMLNYMIEDVMESVLED